MNVLCSAKACPVLLSSTCVFYEGENLIYSGINTNDSVQVALQKLDAAIGNDVFSVSVTSPLTITAGPNPIIGITQSSATVNGYLTSTDWSVFNGKQPQLNGTGFVKVSGTTISYDNSTYYLASNPSAFIALTALSGGTGISYNNLTGVITNSAPDQLVSLTGAGTTTISGTYPNFTITSNDQYTGTVTGTGTTNFLPKWTGASSIGNSLLDDDGTSASVALALGGAFNIKYLSAIKLALTGGTTFGSIDVPIGLDFLIRPDSIEKFKLSSTGLLKLAQYGSGSVTGTRTYTLGVDASGNVIEVTDAGLTSVGLSMPSAFSVANTPLTSNGTLSVTAAGTSAQYVRGDGQLANFPTSGGGGSSVNYYLNGSVSQGTFGGDTYYEMSKSPITGSGTNFTRTNAQGNGYIASFITDAGDPALLSIPGGNWNLEFYFSASSGGGTPSFYGEIYKVSSSNVFTLVASGSINPEVISGGTVVDQYFTSIAIAQTSLLATDRLAIRIYVIPDGRNITLHTENSNLCEVLTTFSTGLNALNGLTSQVQYFATGTSGTDFNIQSLTDTHTFNLPVASGSNTGKLSNIDWLTFNGKENVLTFSAPLTRSVNTVSIPVATTSQPGYLDSTDWTTFNAKVTSVSATSPLFSSGGKTPTLTIQQASGSQNGYLSSTDWTTFNSKQQALNGTGFVKATGTTISYDNSTYALDSVVVKLTGNQTIGGTKTFNGVNFVIANGSNSGTIDFGTAVDKGTIGYSATNNGFIFNSQIAALSLAKIFQFQETNTTVFSITKNGFAIAESGFIVDGGSISEFLKADGSLDSNTYALDSSVVHNTGTETVAGTKTFSSAPKLSGALLVDGSLSTLSGHLGIGAATNGIVVKPSNAGTNNLYFQTGGFGYTYTFPANSGTLALTSDIPSLSGYVTGTGTTNYLPKWTSGSAIGNSIVQDNGSSVGIGVSSFLGGYKLEVSGLQRNFGANNELRFGEFDANNNYFQGINLAGTVGKGFIFFGTSEYMRITPTGNVGIYTTTPATTLQVNGTFASNALWTDASSIAYWGSYPTAYGGLTWDSGYALVFATGGNALRLGANGTNTFMTINTTGNVGINCTGANAKLEVVATTGEIFRADAASGAYRIVATQTGVHMNGDVGIGTATPAYKLDVNRSSLGTIAQFIANDGTYNPRLLINGTIDGLQLFATFSTGADALMFGTGNTEKMRLTSGGNLLVGTTANNGSRVQITSASGDSHLNVWGATAPSIRIDNAASGATQRFVLGLATATNNFIQGASAGDICITTATASPMVFGMWQTSTASEVMRITTSNNLLINKTTDGGQKLQVSGKVNFASLPTSSAGLSAGDIWNNGGVLNIV